MLSSLLSIFSAGESGIHISLKPEPVFEIGPFVVTNSILYGLLVSTVLIILFVSLAKKSKVRPQKSRFVALFEMLVEMIIGLLESAFGSRQKAVKYAPIFGTFFLFIFFTNLSGLLPIVGPGINVPYEGIDIPVFRPFTADLNGTLAMAIIAIVTVQVLSIREQGTKGHLKHYFSDKPFNPINLFIGFLEVIGEFTRILSLSLRLFLNTAVGEILIAVFTSLVLSGGRTPLAVIPIILFEILVAGIQAYVFTVLTATYLALAIAHAHHDEDHHESPALKVEELKA